MTGKEIYSWIVRINKDYIDSPEDDLPQPEILLTEHQLSKLIEEVGIMSMYYNLLQHLNAEEMNHINIMSVRITKKKGK